MNYSVNLKNSYIGLPSVRKDLLIESLESSERKALLSCLKDNTSSKTQQVAKSILPRFKEILESPIPVTRADDSRTILRWASKAFYYLCSEVSYLFGYLTAQKTISLANNILVKSNPNSIQLSALRKLITQERLTNPDQPIRLAELLKSHSYPTNIHGIEFEGKDFFKGVDLEGISFNECEFDWCLFSNQPMRNVIFQSCYLANSSFMNSTIDDCSFQNCTLQEVMFIKAQIKNTDFLGCSLIASSFEDATLKHTLFSETLMKATHFLGADIENCLLSKCELIDNEFFGTLSQFNLDNYSTDHMASTVPTTAIVMPPENRGETAPKAFMKVDQSSKVIPLKIGTQAQEVEPQKLNAEIENALEAIAKAPRTNTPIPQQLIALIQHNPGLFPEATKIYQKVLTLSDHVNSFFLIGGEDIPPLLYGAEEEESTLWDNDYRRSMLELFMVHQAFHKGIPIIGLCRGFQIANVYFGAQLVQDIKGHENKVQHLTFNDHRTTNLYLGKKDKDASFYAIASHHQAVTEDTAATEHLIPSISHDKVIKASELKYPVASDMILLQFHPEYYKTSTSDALPYVIMDTYISLVISEKNERFWETFSRGTRVHRNRKQVLSELTSRVQPYPSIAEIAAQKEAEARALAPVLAW